MMSWDPSRPLAGGRGTARAPRLSIRTAAVALVLVAAACSSSDHPPGSQAAEITTATPTSAAVTSTTGTVAAGVTTTSTFVMDVTTTSDLAVTTSTSPVPETMTSTTAGEAVDVVDDGDAEDGTEEGAAVPEDHILWTGCEFAGLECGVVTVPLDYRDPTAGVLDLAIAVHRATDPDRRIGYLVVNPGGPGGSGVEMVTWALDGPGAVFTAPVLERFDIVGFDPRGRALGAVLRMRRARSAARAAVAGRAPVRHRR